ncbi:Thymidylate kinase [Aequoribacter fuscus]|uniref:Thymidylate kinase n=1 Tax=Aequoribacter fuscus TaxID=2518989 RepID=F3L163_9GAMM|nr:dTMP kinase [Aequoribacter fuscus]EGG30008.1 Thymidylate kinase [Aequoribacter fuscus]QHJ88006.1 dTMP kinase [Aequoribacter fuscus]
MRKGYFITFEGGEGTGKSTQLALVKEALEQRGIKVCVTREPGGTELAEEIRRVLLSPRNETVDPTTELLLMFAARAQHLAQVILPAVDRGEWVLCDRFTDATYAYQQGGRGVDEDKIAILERLVQMGFNPDLTLLFDAPIEISLQRMRDRGALDRFEQEGLEFMKRVRSTYLTRARVESERFRVIDATATVDDVRASVNLHLEPLVNAWVSV